MKRISTNLFRLVACFVMLQLFLTAKTASAAHEYIYSADLTYSHIKGDSVKLTLTTYLVCSQSIPITSFDYINITPKGEPTFKVMSQIVSSEYVNSRKPWCKDCAACSGTVGVLKFVSEAIVDLKNYKGCEFTFSWSFYPRQPDGVQKFYSQSVMNRCVQGYVNSPKFAFEPFVYTCINEKIQRSFAATIGEEDSLSYSFTQPLTASGSTYTYPAPYSYTNPIQNTLFTLNNKTGAFSFQPTKEDYSFMAVKVEQFVKDANGVMTKVGEVTRDASIITFACNSNKAPSVSVSYPKNKSLYLCAGTALQMDFSTLDSDVADSAKIIAKYNIPGASFAITSNAKKARYKFQWTPDSNDIRPNPYKLYLTIYDDKGPLPGLVQTEYDIYVIDKRPELEITQTNKFCGEYQLSPTGDTAEVKTYSWKVSYTENAVVKTLNSTAKDFQFKIPQNGKYFITLFIENKSGCTSTYYDTLEVSDEVRKPDILKDTVICLGSSIALNPANDSSFTYIWSPAEGLSDTLTINPIATPLKNTLYKVAATDTNGCMFQDSVLITVSDFTITVTNDTTMCYNKPVKLKAFSLDDLTYLWTSTENIADPAAAEITVNPAKKTTYIVTAKNALGCIRTDSVVVNVSRSNAYAGEDKRICFGDTVLLTAGGGASFTWLNEQNQTVSTEENFYVSPTKSQIYYLYAKDSLNCHTTTDTVMVNVDDDCVWPGDANKDGIVNYKDVLFIGVGNYSFGEARIDSSNTWAPKSATDWNKYTADSINFKHMDMDGDGIIVSNDMNAISRNYYKTKPGYTHIPFTQPVTGTPLFAHFDQDTFYAGDTVKAKILLGNKDFYIADLYGAAVQYSLVSNVIVDNNQYVEVENAFFMKDNMGSMTFTNLQNNVAEIAITRMDTINASGYGEIAEITMVLQDSNYNYSQNGEKLSLYLTDALVIDRMGKKHPVIVESDSTIVLRKESSGIIENNVIGDVSLYPNPAKEQVTITFGRNITGEIYITNVLGQVMEIVKMQNQTAKVIDTKHFPAGIYMIQIQAANKLSTQKLIISR